MYLKLNFKLISKQLYIITWLINHIKCNEISSKFLKITNNKIEYNDILANNSAETIIRCALNCVMNNECWYFSYEENQCILYNKFAKFYLKPSNQSFYYEKIIEGLEYYWPVHNSSVKEIIQGVDLTEGYNVGFTSDRFGNPNSAISFNSGYYVFPNNYYFGGEITVMAWVRSRIITSSMRVIDFGNGSPLDNIVLSLSTGTTQRPFFELYYNVNSQAAISPDPINTYVWYHIAGVFKNNISILYINGTQKANKTANVKIGFRYYNYIGKSKSVVSPATADYDDIKIYNRALTDYEINNQFQNSNL